MKKSIPIFILTLFLSSIISAKDLRKSAEENPLDCAFYLLTKDKGDINAETLAQVYFDIGNFDKAIKSLDFETNDYSKLMWLSHYSEKLIKQNKYKPANKFLDKALSILRADEDSDWENSYTQSIAYSLAKSNREKEALEISSHQEGNFYQVLVLNTIGKALFDKGNKEKSLYYFDKSYRLLELNSENLFEASQIGSFFAKLNQPKRAVEIADLIEQKLINS